MAGKRVIIAGQGLSGSVMALNLLRKGYDVTLADLPGRNNSSTVAAGIIKPVTGRRQVKIHKSEAALPYATEFYRYAEQLLEVSFYDPKPLLQFFSDAGTGNEWFKRAATAGYEKYIGDFSSSSFSPEGYKTHAGSVRLLQCGYLNTLQFLISVHDFFKSKDKFINAHVPFDLLPDNSNTIRFVGLEFDWLIWCAGGKSNVLPPPFDFVPLKPVKGELIHFYAEGLDTSGIVSMGKFILPVGQHRFVCGATYDWDTLDEVPTADGRIELEKWLHSMLKTDFTITDHKAGIRPATQDRKPVYGLHPVYENVGILNGMGSKGVMLAPYYAEQLILQMDTGRITDTEASLNRFL